MTRTSPPSPAVIAATLLIAALLLPALASAQTDRERELEVRVAELERLVQQLLQQQAAPEEPKPAEEPAATPPSPPGTQFTYGGFIKVNTMFSDYSDGNPPAGSVGRDFYLPGAIPVAAPGANTGTDGVWDAHAKQSRFWLATNTTLSGGARLETRLEMDFAVPVGGDERNTNTYTPVLRRAFFTYNRWLFGQEWSNFMEPTVLPETTDFIGATEGTVFVRQAQIRYTRGSWSFSLENPETTLAPFGGGTRIVTDQNFVPDVAVRYRHTTPWGALMVSGVGRQLKREVPGGPDASELGFGVNLSGRIDFGADDLRLMATYGSGIGRYIGLNFFEDGVLDAGGQIAALDVVAAYAAYRHVWGGTWRSNVILGYASVDNPASLTGPAANAQARSARVNLLWSPQPKLDFGVEVSAARRVLEDGRRGELRRLDFLARYSF